MDNNYLPASKLTPSEEQVVKFHLPYCQFTRKSFSQKADTGAAMKLMQWIRYENSIAAAN